MTPTEAAALKPGQWIRWHSHLDGYIDGKVLAEGEHGYRVEWQDGHISRITPEALARATFEVYHDGE